MKWLRRMLARRRSRRYWSQFAQPGRTVADQLEFARANLTGVGAPATLWR